MLIPKPITDHGWYLHENCRCGGILMYKFRHLQKKGLQINWRVYYYDFKVYDGNSTKVAYTKISQIEKRIKGFINQLSIMRLVKETSRTGKTEWHLDSDWLELYFRFAKPQFKLDKYGYFDERPQIITNASYLLLLITVPLCIILSVPIAVAIVIICLQLFFGWGETYLSLPIKTGMDKSESPTYGFYFYGEGRGRFFFDTIWLCNGNKRKVFYMPWSLDWVRTSALRKDGSWEHEVRGDRKEFYDDKWKDILFLETHSYAYTLKSGTVQNVDATIKVEEMEWRPKWFKWTSIFARKRKSISIDFSDEVGERAGSWKGGTLGCGYDMKAGETPLDCLRRMEKQRKFN